MSPKENTGIGRQKELHLDEIVLRWEYVDERLTELRIYPIETRRTLGGLLVLSDVLHDVEKQLAKLNHTADKP